MNPTTLLCSRIFSVRLVHWTSCLSLGLILWLGLVKVQAQSFSTVEDIPNPKDGGQGYISDPAGLLPLSDFDSITHVLETLERRTGVETAIVIIPDFNEDEDDFSFATELFRQWGIGKAKANNGLLLFIATQRRQYRFITGDGLEGILPDATLKTMGEELLVPAFRKQEYGEGILATVRTLSDYLQQPAHEKELSSLLRQYKPRSSTDSSGFIIFLVLVGFAGLAFWQLSSFTKGASVKIIPNRYSETLEIVVLGLVFVVGILIVLLFFTGSISKLFQHFAQVLPYLTYVTIVFVLFFKHLHTLAHLRSQYRDDPTFFSSVQHLFRATWWQVLLSPPTLLYPMLERIRSQRSTSRFTPPLDSQGQAMQRLNPDEASDRNGFLSTGQQVEEKLNSLTYDVWLGSQGERKIIPHPSDQYETHLACPACGFRTLSEPITLTVTRATQHQAGTGKQVRICRHCKHEVFIKSVVKAPLAEQRSGSSTLSGSSSSSSSSSSGSWGGGTTGGGGAGGSW
ncbi:hypothetical protein C5O19_16140 [Siphonobacter curvatus]|uniref:TPM domain-containing protein n=1 Tax=Siphonobacter curvatus TaxID=2094562 RepID=A0A2S7IK37_9BACT|nr:hypothetical protein C5O19_16140 [Siphonobacter curvatus]